MLHGENGVVAVVQSWREGAVVALLPPRRVDDQHLGGIDHRFCAQIAVDQPQPQISPGHEPASGNDVIGVDDELIHIQAYIWEAGHKVLDIHPVRGRRASCQQSGFAEQECPGADRCQPDSGLVLLAQPIPIGPSGLGGNRRLEARRQYQHAGGTAGFGVGVVNSPGCLAGFAQLPMADAQRRAAWLAHCAIVAPGDVEQIGQAEYSRHLDAGVKHNT